MLCLFSDTHKHKHLSSLEAFGWSHLSILIFALIQVIHSLSSRVGMKIRRFIFSIFFPSRSDGKKVYLDINEFEKSLGRLVIELIFPIFLQNSFKHDIVFYNPVKFPNHFHSYFPIFSSFEQKALVSECLVHGWKEASNQRSDLALLRDANFRLGSKSQFFLDPLCSIAKTISFYLSFMKFMVC